MKKFKQWLVNLPQTHPYLPIVISCIGLGVSLIALLLRIWMGIALS